MKAFAAEQKRRAVVLDRHKLPAPFDGVISKRMVEVGQWVTPGTAVFELVAMKNFRVDVPVPQDYYAQLRDGADVAIEIDTLPGEEIPAKIGALIPVSDPDARTFTLRVLPTRDQHPHHAWHVGTRSRRSRHGAPRRGREPGRADPLSRRAHHRLGLDGRRRQDERHRTPD